MLKFGDGDGANSSPPKETTSRPKKSKKPRRLVETILSMRVRDGQKFYFIKWLGKSSAHCSWVKEHQLVCPRKLSVSFYLGFGVMSSFVKRFTDELRLDIFSTVLLSIQAFHAQLNKVKPRRRKRAPPATDNTAECETKPEDEDGQDGQDDIDTNDEQCIVLRPRSL